MDSTTDSRAAESITRSGSLVRGRTWWLVVGLLLGLAAAYAYTSSQPKTYTSSATVLVKPVGAVVTTGATTRDTSVNLDTEAQIVKSQLVAKGAQALLKSTEPMSKISQSVKVSVPTNTSVLQISSEAPTATGAQQRAAAFARAYLTNRKNAASTDVKQRQSSITDQIKVLQAQLQAVSGKIVTLPSVSSERTLAQARQNILVNQLSILQSQFAALAGSATDVGSVIKEAGVPSKPSWPILPINLAAGALVGLLAGLLLALARARMDHRVRGATEVEDDLGLPVLADVPPQQNAAGVAAGSTASATAYYNLRNAVVSARRGAALRTILVTTPKGPGASLVAGNLAATLARSGEQVLLISASGSAATSRMLGLSDSRGLADIVDDGRVLGDVAQYVDGLPGLTVVSSSSDGAVTADHLQSRRLVDLLATARDAADVVVIEGPPVRDGAGAQALAGLADAVVLVVRPKRIKTDDVADARRQFDVVGTPLLGAVVLRGARAEAPASPVPAGAQTRPAVRRETPEELRVELPTVAQGWER